MALLSLQDVRVAFAGLTALDHVSLEAHSGQVLAVIGPNGAGKSTLFNAIAGYVPLAGGSIRFDGRDIRGLPIHVIAALGMRRTFQNGGAFGAMTTLENVLTGLSQRIASNPMGLLFGLAGARRAEAEAREQAIELLHMMGLAALAHRPARELSAGQQRLVEITRALAARARLLLLDEPAVGLTTAEREHLVTILRRLCGEGIAVVLVEHAVDMVMAVSDRVAVLNYGKLIATGSPQEIRVHPAVLEAYLGQP
jgi:branched-chain amino acid transport system ATP-binding protein